MQFVRLSGTPSPRRRRAILSGALTLASLLAGCLNLDSFLFSDEALDSYSYDSYDGERECETYLAVAGPIDPSLIHEVTFPSGSETIYGEFLHTAAACDTGDTLILYCHGKSDHMDRYWPRTRLLYDAGFDSAAHPSRYPVLAFDYRGFGRSTGEPTEEGLYADGAAALLFIREHLGDPKVMVYTYSLGSLVGCKLAADDTEGRILRLMMEAPVGSVTAIVSDAAYLDIPGSMLSTYEGNNVERIKAVTAPYLWLHGTNDGTLAIETHGQPIWDNYAGPEGAAVVVKGAGHRDVPETISADFRGYQRIVASFIQGREQDDGVADLFTEFKP